MRLIVIAFMAIVLTSCAYIPHSTFVSYSTEKYSPTKKWDQIEVLKEKPRRKHISLGEIVGEIVYGNMDAVLKNMKLKAAAVGGDALHGLELGGGTMNRSKAIVIRWDDHQ